MADYFLILLSLTYEVLLKTSLSAGLWFTFVEYSVSSFYRSYKIVDIFSDENFQNQSSSFPKENICDIENSKVEFYTPILIDSRLSCCVSGNV